MIGCKVGRKSLTQKRVKELFRLDYGTGVVTRRITVTYNAKKGDIVGSGSSPHGYLIVNIDGQRYLLHRIIFLYVHGYTPEGQVDHENRDRRDNRPCNLREVSQSCNMRNAGLRSNNISGVKGVCWYAASGGSWHARIKTECGGKHLGYYDDFTEAVAHRLAAEQCTGWLGCDSNSSAYQYMQEYVKREA